MIILFLFMIIPCLCHFLSNVHYLQKCSSHTSHISIWIVLYHHRPIFLIHLLSSHFSSLYCIFALHSWVFLLKIFFSWYRFYLIEVHLTLPRQWWWSWWDAIHNISSDRRVVVVVQSIDRYMYALMLLVVLIFMMTMMTLTASCDGFHFVYYLSERFIQSNPNSILYFITISH